MGLPFDDEHKMLRRSKGHGECDSPNCAAGARAAHHGSTTAGYDWGAWHLAQVSNPVPTGDNFGLLCPMAAEALQSLFVYKDPNEAW